MQWLEMLMLQNVIKVGLEFATMIDLKLHLNNNEVDKVSHHGF